MLVAIALSVAAAEDLRALHLSPDAPVVDIFVDNGMPAAVAGLAFTQGTPYVTLGQGTFNVKVAPTGSPPSAAVLDLDLPLAAGGKLSAIAYGPVSDLRAMALVDDDSGIAPGNIRIQVAHTAVGVGTVDVLVAGIGTAYAGLGYGESFVADLPAGAADVGLDTNADGTPDWTFAVPDPGAGLRGDVFAAPDADGQPFLLAWLPDGSTARVDGVAVAPARLRVAHLSPDAPAVDVWVDGAPAAMGLSFEENTGYVSVPAGPRRVEVFVAGTTTGAVFETTVSVRSGRDYTAAAWGNLANIDLGVARDGACASTTSTCFTVFHAADGVGTVDVWDAGAGVKLIDDLAFGGAQRLRVPAAAYDIALDADQDGAADFVFAVPNVGAGIRVNVMAVLDASGPFLYAMLPDGSAVRIDPM